MSLFGHVLPNGLFAAGGLVLPHVNYTTILPELILLGGMLLLLAAAALSPRQIPTEAYATTTVGIAAAALVASLVLWRDVTRHGPFVAVAHSIVIDGFSVFVHVLVASVLVVAAILAPSYLRREGIVGCEYYALALIAGSGAMFMSSANDLVLVFLGLEILSIPLYVLAGFDQRRSASGEAAMKYFVLGAFASAIFVYGIALTYGATGSTNLAQIAAFLALNVVTHNGVLLAGLALLLVGFAFKIAAVPFHMWTPDVYQGAPTPAAGFMAAIAKAGGFAALLRVFVSTFPSLRSSWQPIVWVLAGLTLLVGAVLALVQRDVKRMLAYSSINHAGFALLGLQAATARGVAGSLYYLFVYGFLVLGSFAVVAVVAGKGDDAHDLGRYRGLARRKPLLAGSFAVLLLAQAGAPFTTGFFSKFYVVLASVDAHSYALAAIAMTSAAIAAFFYLRLVFLMFGEEPADLGTTQALSAEPFPAAGGVATLVAPTITATRTEIEVSRWAATGIALTVATTIIFGVWPQPIVGFAHQATLLFR